MNDALDELRNVLGADTVDTSPAALALASGDLFDTGPLPLAVVRPATADGVAAAVAVAADHGLPVVPRGGGLSYTGGVA